MNQKDHLVYPAFRIRPPNQRVSIIEIIPRLIVINRKYKRNVVPVQMHAFSKCACAYA